MCAVLHIKSITSHQCEDCNCQCCRDSVRFVCIPSSTRERLQPRIYRLYKLEVEETLLFAEFVSQSAEKNWCKLQEYSQAESDQSGTGYMWINSKMQNSLVHFSAFIALNTLRQLSAAAVYFWQVSHPKNDPAHTYLYMKCDYSMAQSCFQEPHASVPVNWIWSRDGTYNNVHIFCCQLLKGELFSSWETKPPQHENGKGRCPLRETIVLCKTKRIPTKMEC